MMRATGRLRLSGTIRARLWSSTTTRVSPTTVYIDRIPSNRRHDQLRFVHSTTPSSLTASTTLPGLSKREWADLEDRLWRNVGQKVKDPILGQSLAQLQWLHRRVAVSENGTLQILLRLPSLLHPGLAELKDAVKAQVVECLSEYTHVQAAVNVEAMAVKPVPFMARIVDDHDELLSNLGPGLASVSHLVAVYSCKGGVGKSTIAVNLAYELAQRGGRVGLLDLDLFGPSLPVLIRPADTAVRPSPMGEGMVFPIEHEGVKCFSLGYVSVNSGVPGSGSDNGAAVMRGPMAGKVVTQLLKGTDWGELDVLLLDLPPGTGDIQLQVLQEIQLSGAVAVTTPSRLATVDTRKGVEMFTSLGVPTLSVVENMAYFVCEGGGRHYPFGQSSLTNDAGDNEPLVPAAKVIPLPVSMATTEANDSGVPLCLARPSEAEEELAAFAALADNVAAELLKLQYGKTDDSLVVKLDGETFDTSTLQLSLDKTTGTFLVRLYSEAGATQKRVSPQSLRSRDPRTGEIIPDSPFRERSESTAASMVTQHHVGGGSKPSPSLSPTKVERKGRYGYGVLWADGASIIYSMRSLALAAGGIVRD